MLFVKRKLKVLNAMITSNKLRFHYYAMPIHRPSRLTAFHTTV